MELIDRERLLVDVASLKQSPWFNRGKNEQFLHSVYLERKEAVETVEDLCIKSEPTVEAIPKADYENCLKADMVAMLTELKSKMNSIKECEHQIYGKEEWNFVGKCQDVVQQKINTLEEQKDETDKSNK